MGVPTAPSEQGATSEAPCPDFCEFLHRLDGDHRFDNEIDCYLWQACLAYADPVGVCQGCLECVDPSE
jgi:hypothetical protein